MSSEGSFEGFSGYANCLYWFFLGRHLSIAFTLKSHGIVCSRPEGAPQCWSQMCDLIKPLNKDVIQSQLLIRPHLRRLLRHWFGILYPRLHGRYPDYRIGGFRIFRLLPSSPRSAARKTMASKKKKKEKKKKEK